MQRPTWYARSKYAAWYAPKTYFLSAYLKSLDDERPKLNIWRQGEANEICSRLSVSPRTTPSLVRKREVRTLVRTTENAPIVRYPVL